MKLSEQEVAEALLAISEWTLEEKVIVRRFRFPDFQQAMHFVNDVAEAAEARNHHPFISIDYKVVTLRLTSWHAGGLTAEDFAEAREFNRLYNPQSPPTVGQPGHSPATSGSED